MTEQMGLYGNENHMIRIPKVLRTNLQRNLGERIPFTCVQGKPVVLEISEAFKHDSEQDSSVCYVTEETFNTINIERTPIYIPKQIETITLGCDPEFFLLDRQSKKLLRAYMFFKKFGEVGNDGILAEFRPKPTLTPQDLTNNIYKLIVKTKKLLSTNSIHNPDDIILHAASSYEGYTAGFHLHYGLPKEMLGRKSDRLVVIKKIMRALDYYIGIPAIMAEEVTDFKRRVNTYVSYGKPSDFRIDHRTLEYRVPGGSLLRHPDLTLGLIALGSTVITDLMVKVKSITNEFKHLSFMNNDDRLQEMYPNTPRIMTMYEIICSPNTDRAKTYLDSIYNDITRMIDFNKNSKAINKLFTILSNNKELIDQGMELNWRNTYEQRHHFHQTSN